MAPILISFGRYSPDLEAKRTRKQMPLLPFLAGGSFIFPAPAQAGPRFLKAWQSMVFPSSVLSRCCKSPGRSRNPETDAVHPGWREQTTTSHASAALLCGEYAASGSMIWPLLDYYRRCPYSHDGIGDRARSLFFDLINSAVTPSCKTGPHYGFSGVVGCDEGDDASIC